jgi:hypothetical protein
MRKVALGWVALAVALSMARQIAWAAEEPAKPKHSISQVMKSANKTGGLLSTVKSGKATPEERLQLLDYYISLVENKPPKGDMDSWQTLAGKATLAAAKVVVGRAGATAELDAATKCAVCHKAHK